MEYEFRGVARVSHWDHGNDFNVSFDIAFSASPDYQINWITAIDIIRETIFNRKDTSYVIVDRKLIKILTVQIWVEVSKGEWQPSYHNYS